MKQLKDRNYAFRVSAKDLDTIKKKAKKAKMTVTDYITQSSLGKEVIIIDGLPEIVSQLKKIGNNLNQLTMLSYQGLVKTVILDETEASITAIYWKINELAKEVALVAVFSAVKNKKQIKGAMAGVLNYISDSNKVYYNDIPLRTGLNCNYYSGLPRCASPNKSIKKMTIDSFISSCSHLQKKIM